MNYKPTQTYQPPKYKFMLDENPLNNNDSNEKSKQLFINYEVNGG